MERPKCACGNLCKKNSFSKKDGRQLFNTYCRSCAKTKHGARERINKIVKGCSCDHCGFIAVNSCQLDIDHIDGNSKNNRKENLQTLCANCHRLKTFNNKDWNPST